MAGRPSKPQAKFPNRLRELRLAARLTQQQVAKRAHYSQQTLQRYETGERQLKVEQLNRFATALRCAPTEILPDASGRDVPVVGYVGAGQEVFPVDDYAPGEGLSHIACPPQLDPDVTFAVIVKGDSMLPIEDGWRLFCVRQVAVPGDAIGHLCVVKLANDGPTLVKQVRRGYSPGLFNLVSTNAGPREDAELEWASRVRVIVPPDDMPRQSVTININVDPPTK